MLDDLKTLLLVSAVLPQSPIKPLSRLTRSPRHTSIRLGDINADLLLPNTGPAHPAVILAMGVKISDQDRSIMLKFAETMSRLGFAVLWPRLAVLDEGEDLPEDPSTFVEAFRYLEVRPDIDASRISYLGFSIGSSLSLVAAAHTDIAARVRSVIFFGGFYDVESYVLAIAAGAPWRPSDDAREHFRNVLESARAYSVLKVLDARTRSEAEVLLRQADPAELGGLHRLSPSLALDTLRAPIFILHDKGDTYVPYTESLALDRALGPRRHNLTIVDLFEHVQPNRALTWKDAREILRLYGFIRRTVAYL